MNESEIKVIRTTDKSNTDLIENNQHLSKDNGCFSDSKENKYKANESYSFRYGTKEEVKK